MTALVDASKADGAPLDAVVTPSTHGGRVAQPSGDDLAGQAQVDPTRCWSCVIPGKPRTKGNSARILRFGGINKIVPSAAAVKAEGDARSVIAACAPASPFVGAVVVDAVFVFAVAQGKRKGRNKIEFGSPCLKPVDRGNLLKLLEDAMNGLVYLDDRQVVGGDVRKLWGDVDETRVTVRVVDAVVGGAA